MSQRKTPAPSRLPLDRASILSAGSRYDSLAQDLVRRLSKMSAYGDNRFWMSPCLPLFSTGENRCSVTGQSALTSEGEAVSTVSFAV
jgi:hypothetical protein